MNEVIKKRRVELLNELKTNIPQIEWELGEVKEEKRYLINGTILTETIIHFSGIHKKSKDDCFIIDNGNEISITCGYYHNGKISFNNGENKRLIFEDSGRTTGVPFKNIWEKSNEFFIEFCIGKVGREEKIRSGEMITPNMENWKDYGKNEMSVYEYSQGLLNLFLPNHISWFNKYPTNYINNLFERFENQFRELMKKTNSKEDYKRFYEDKNKYFGTPSEMVLSFLDNQLYDGLELYLEDLWNKVESEMNEVSL